MSDFFSVDGKIYATLNLLADVAVVSILVSLTSIPVVTMGAGISAGHFVLIGRLEERGEPIFSVFWRQFLANLRPSLGCSIALVLIYILAIWQFIFIIAFSPTGEAGELVICFLVAGMLGVVALLTMLASWIFWLIAQFVNTTKGYIRNAGLLLVKYLPISIINLALVLFPVFLSAIRVELSGFLVLVYLFFGTGFTMYLQDLLRMRVRKALIASADSTADTLRSRNE